MGSEMCIRDSGISYDFQKGQFNEVTLEAAKGKVKLKRTKEYKQKRYQLIDYEFIN